MEQSSHEPRAEAMNNLEQPTVWFDEDKDEEYAEYHRRWAYKVIKEHGFTHWGALPNPVYEQAMAIMPDLK